MKVGCDGRKRLQDQVYQPLYAEAFQKHHKLTCSHFNAPPEACVLTQVSSVPLEKQSYLKYSKASEASNKNRLEKLCFGVGKQKNVCIKGWLLGGHVITMVTGASMRVVEAREALSSKLSFRMKTTLQIDSEQHRILMADEGRRLNQIQADTFTRISRHRDDVVSIVGAKQAVERAKRCILDIASNEENHADLASISIEVPQCQHKYIIGFRGEGANKIFNQTGVLVTIPSSPSSSSSSYSSSPSYSSSQSYSSTSSAYSSSTSAYSSTSAHSSLSSSYSFSSSSSITLTGRSHELGPALSAVYARANSIVVRETRAPAWVHKYLIGGQGVGVRKIAADAHMTALEFCGDTVKMEGPIDEVEKVQADVEAITELLLKEMAFAEVTLNKKQEEDLERIAVAVSRLKSQHCVLIERVAKGSGGAWCLRVEGRSDRVLSAHKNLLALLQILNHYESRELPLHNNYRNSLIGYHGNQIRTISDRFPDVTIRFSTSTSSIPATTILPTTKTTTQSKVTQLTLTASSTKTTTSSPSTIKIIPLPATTPTPSTTDATLAVIAPTTTKAPTTTQATRTTKATTTHRDVVLLRGPRQQLDSCVVYLRTLIRQITEVNFRKCLRIDKNFHSCLIGRNGVTITKICKTTQTSITFPKCDRCSDVVTVKGRRRNVEEACHKLNSLYRQLQDIREVSVQIPPQFKDSTPLLLACSIARDKVWCRYIATEGCLRLRGSEANVAENVEKLRLNMENMVTVKWAVPRRQHGLLLVNGGTVLNQITCMYKVHVVVPSKKESIKCLTSEQIKYKKIKNKKSKKIMEQKEFNLRKDRKYIEESEGLDRTEFKEGIKIYGNEEETELQMKSNEIIVEDKIKACVELNGNKDQDDNEKDHDMNRFDDGSDNDDDDLVSITGLPENCQAAKAALKALLPVTIELRVPTDLHGGLIGQSGAMVKGMMKTYMVNIVIPPATSNCEVVRIEGREESVRQAQVGVEKKVEELRLRKLRSFKMDVEVDYRSRMRLMDGSMVRRMKKLYDVSLFCVGTSLLRVVGLEEDVKAAKEDLMEEIGERVGGEVGGEMKKHKVKKEKPSKKEAIEVLKVSRGFVVRGAPWS